MEQLSITKAIKKELSRPILIFGDGREPKGHKRQSKTQNRLVPFGFRKEKDTQERRPAALKRWLKRIFYNPRHSKPADENILRLLMPSVVGIALCMVCLAGSTWAWFSASIQTEPQTIEAASFDISAVVTDAGGQPVPSGQLLEAGQKYTVTLTAAGSAPSGGYCEVESGAVSLYTETILPNESLTFTLIPETEAAYTFTAVWGKYSRQGGYNQRLHNRGGTAGNRRGNAWPADKRAKQRRICGTVRQHPWENSADIRYDRGKARRI